MRTGGLSLEQAPRLSVPASFFLTIPVGILLAGCILLMTGNVAFISPWMPHALALTHAGTIGVLAMGMFGALYQMIPVVAGSVVPLTRLAHLVHALLLVGLILFTWRLLGGPYLSMTAAMISFSVALLAFLLPVAWSMFRAATKNDTVQGMRLAILSLLLISVMGLVMAQGFADGLFSENRMMWVQIHLSVALLGWVGGLIMAVSWQVIPMFYLASPAGKTTTRWLTSLLLTGLVLTLLSVFVAPGASTHISPGLLAGMAALPAATVVWLIHPILVLRAISQRKRKRGDASLLFWNTGLVMALLLIPVAVAALLMPDPRWQILFGWLAIWGWAGMIMHGMLSRIVPFLVWFHRYSSKVGFEPTPSMRSLLSQQRIKLGFYLHTASVVLGVAAIASQQNLLARLTGFVLILTAISVAVMLLQVLKPESKKTA